MDKLQNKFLGVSATIIFVAAIFTSAQTLAQTTLNGMEISSNSRSYDIVLNTDKGTTINKKNVSSDSLELNLKNTKIAKNARTVYKNADGIEHIILKPKANDLKIEINGNSVANSNVALASAKVDDTIFINKPLNAYAPIHSFEEETKTTELSLLSVLRKIKNSQTLRNLLDSSNLGWIISFVMMFGLLIATNNKNRKRSQLSFNITEVDDKENKILKAAMERADGLIAQGTGTRRTSLMQPKPQPKTTNVQQANYGLKAYNNQTKSPSSNNSLKSNNVPLKRDELLDTIPQNANIPTRRAMSTATANQLKQDMQKNEVQIDNVKFLESMAKIYERSGRVDLANGLTKNIKKVKNNLR